VTAKRQRREYAIASPGKLSEELAGRILFVSRTLLDRQRAASILSQKCPTNCFNWFFALRSLIAFHVGLGVSIIVRLVRTKNWAALVSFVGDVYERESVSCCRLLLCDYYLCAHPLGAPESLPEVPGVSFFWLFRPDNTSRGGN